MPIPPQPRIYVNAFRRYIFYELFRPAKLYSALSKSFRNFIIVLTSPQTCVYANSTTTAYRFCFSYQKKFAAFLSDVLRPIEIGGKIFANFYPVFFVYEFSLIQRNIDIIHFFSCSVKRFLQINWIFKI